MIPQSWRKILLQQGVRGVVLKLGSRGAYLASGAVSGELLQPFVVRAVDTTAAGDAFNGAFADGLLMEKGAKRQSADFARLPRLSL